MHDYVRHYLASTAAHLLPVGASALKRQLTRQLLPYCVTRVGAKYLLLNRNYKPLGFPIGLRSRVDYADPAFTSWLIDADVTDARIFESHTNNADGEFHFLYGGPTHPPYIDAAAARAYAVKLCALIGCTYVTKDGAK